MTEDRPLSDRVRQLEAELTLARHQVDIARKEIAELRADNDKLAREKHQAVQALVTFQSFERKQERRIGKRKR